MAAQDAEATYRRVIEIIASGDRATLPEVVDPERSVVVVARADPAGDAVFTTIASMLAGPPSRRSRARRGAAL